MPGLEDDQDTTGDTDHQTGYGDIFKSIGHFFCDGVRSPAHDKGADNTHDQEGGGNIAKAPALDFYTPDDHHDPGYQNSQNGFLPNAERMFMYVIF